MLKQLKLCLCGIACIEAMYLFKTNVISADSSTTLFYEEKLADSDDNLGSTTSNTVIQLLLFFFYFYITAKKIIQNQPIKALGRWGSPMPSGWKNSSTFSFDPQLSLVLDQTL